MNAQLAVTYTTLLSETLKTELRPVQSLKICRTIGHVRYVVWAKKSFKNSETKERGKSKSLVLHFIYSISQ